LEYEEHKLRLKKLQISVQLEEERLKAAKNRTDFEQKEHSLKIEILQEELNSKTNATTN